MAIADKKHARALELALIAEGLAPANGRLIEIIVSPVALPVIRYEVLVRRDEMGKLARAFTVAAADAIKSA